MQADEWIIAAPLSERQALPVVVQPRVPGLALTHALAGLPALIETALATVGGVLLRDFTLDGVDGFQRFAASWGAPLLPYEFGSTPRTQVVTGVYTSTEYPPHQTIPLHNEQAYTREWPMKIWFYCAQAPLQGGQTPIADSRRIYQKIPLPIRQRFDRHGLMYIRNYGNGLDVPWTQVFNTCDKTVVTGYCNRHGIACEWKADGELRTRQVCQATARHPKTAEWVWFNQAHLFHVSNLNPEVRETLLEFLAEADLPRNVYYGDGTPIEDSVLDEIRAVLAEETVLFPWQTGDVLMLDNMLTAHARSPFTGPRKIVVAMADAYSATAQV